ncbi:DUF4148 domain-containing protein [Paraburkholderia diazotrophica]|uniref:DUF4148 domain-containing protein n=1 Tax=Paraburkholderia diazotrophica TaxID=667676 RepID=A0A1H7BZA1_9BURK|nr:DUF4148 domain-containing protein [Paraburkholderia diazotrophica]SEJ78675.1 protein of unknown function [Paraburkholderia diazotrophica]
MIRRPDRMAIAGFVVMVVLIVVALALPMDSDRLAAYRSVYGGDENPRSADSSNAEDESVRRSEQLAATSDGTSDADIAFILQSIRASLHRNDLTSAKVLLNAVLSVRTNLPEALELQKELNVREARAAKAMTSVVAAASFSEGSHDASPSPVDEKSDRAMEPPARPSTLVRTSSKSTDRPQYSTRRERPASADKPSAKTRHAGQTPRHHPAAHVSNGRPKTRAEVVNELKRARANGSIPRFGNPSRYGSASSPYHAAR